MDTLEDFAELRPPLTETSALAEADRCLECGGPSAAAPCVVACPAAVDVPTFVREIAAGSLLDAARTIYGSNLLGGTCARVCPAEILCQGACVLLHEGHAPIAIASLQRFATDHFRAEGIAMRDCRPANGLRVAVVGGGPAGLSCAALHDAGYSTEDAVRLGITRTAGTVTSAALIMVAVFGLFATLSLIMMQQLGFGLAVAILIDATIVRAVLVPSVMKLLGERNWYLPAWPTWLPRRHRPTIGAGI